MSPISSTSGRYAASTSAGCVSMWMIRLRPSGFQRDGRVLDRVVADARSTRSARSKPGQDVVARLQPDRHQRQVRPVVDRALAHERDRDRDVEPAGERAQLRRRVPPQDAVAGQDDRAAASAAISRAAWAIASSVGSGK